MEPTPLLGKVTSYGLSYSDFCLWRHIKVHFVSLKWVELDIMSIEV